MSIRTQLPFWWTDEIAHIYIAHVIRCQISKTWKTWRGWVVIFPGGFTNSLCLEISWWDHFQITLISWINSVNLHLIQIEGNRYALFHFDKIIFFMSKNLKILDFLNTVMSFCDRSLWLYKRNRYPPMTTASVCYKHPVAIGGPYSSGIKVVKMNV